MEDHSGASEQEGKMEDRDKALQQRRLKRRRNELIIKCIISLLVLIIVCLLYTSSARYVILAFKQINRFVVYSNVNNRIRNIGCLLYTSRCV